MQLHLVHSVLASLLEWVSRGMGDEHVAVRHAAVIVLGKFAQCCQVCRTSHY